jgi:hypothetical protein
MRIAAALVAIVMIAIKINDMRTRRLACPDQLGLG